MDKLNFIDLFCGIGGFRYALDSLDHNCVFSSDSDKDARRSYKNNFGEIPFGDITKIKNEDIPAHQVLCAGFPCQPFSISGKQNGFSDTRGILLHEILRIAKAHLPEVLFLEHVRNYTSHAGGKTMALTLDLLMGAGYNVFHKVLNSSRFGLAQKRERLYFVCFREDLGVSKFMFPVPCDSNVSIEDILLPKGDPALESLKINRDDVEMTIIPPEERENRPLRIGKVGKGGQGERIYSPKGHSVTLSAFGGGIGAKTGIYYIDGKIRRLHPRECARLMGFPEKYILHERRNVCFKQFGNSVAVPVIKRIFEKVQSALNDSSLQAA